MIHIMLFPFLLIFFLVSGGLDHAKAMQHDDHVERANAGQRAGHVPHVQSSFRRQGVRQARGLVQGEDRPGAGQPSDEHRQGTARSADEVSGPGREESPAGDPREILAGLGDHSQRWEQDVPGLGPEQSQGERLRTVLQQQEQRQPR